MGCLEDVVTSARDGGFVLKQPTDAQRLSTVLCEVGPSTVRRLDGANFASAASLSSKGGDVASGSSRSARVTLDKEQQLFLQVVFDYFDSKEDWPTCSYVQRALIRQYGVKTKAVELSESLAPTLCHRCQWGGDAVTLTLQGISRCDGSERLVGAFFEFLALCIELYYTQDDEPNITRFDIRDHLGWDDDLLRKMDRILRTESHRILGSGGGAGDDWRYEISDDVVDFENVKTIDRYAQIRGEEAANRAVLRRIPETMYVKSAENNKTGFGWTWLRDNFWVPLAVAITAGVATPFIVHAINSPSPRATVQGTLDGKGPVITRCLGGAHAVATTPVRLSGEDASLQLIYSPTCGYSWGRLDFRKLPLSDAPLPIVITIRRPADGAQYSYTRHGNLKGAVYGQMLYSRGACVATSVMIGPEPIEAQTECVRGGG